MHQKGCVEYDFSIWQGAIFILREDIGVGGQKMSISLTLFTENVLTLGVGGSKKAKTSLRNIKMVPKVTTRL